MKRSETNVSGVLLGNGNLMFYLDNYTRWFERPIRDSSIDFVVDEEADSSPWGLLRAATKNLVETWLLMLHQNAKIIATFSRR